MVENLRDEQKQQIAQFLEIILERSPCQHDAVPSLLRQPVRSHNSTHQLGDTE